MSIKLKQGSEYQEEPVEVIGDSKPKIPKKALIAAGVVMAVALVIFGVITMMNREPKQPETSININELEAEITAFKYSPEQVATLRASGYTGDEIEQFEAQQLNFDGMILEAKKLQQEFIKQTYLELKESASNAGSPEYKTLLNMTWLGQSPVEVKPLDGQTAYDFQVETLKENVNYTKVPSRGHQTILRLDFPDGEVIFMPVHPSRYFELRDKGNIVVTYNKVTFGQNFYIIDVSEVPIQ